MVCVFTVLFGILVGVLAHQSKAELTDPIHMFIIKEDPPEPSKVWKSVGIKQHELTHEQEVWLYALEYHESRGNIKAVNPHDRDNTPSHGAFQFKSETVYDFGAKRYKMIPEDLELIDYQNYAYDYDFIREVVIRMIGDETLPITAFRDYLFPDVVKNKLRSLPPR
jgi:hypothetical protein